MFNGNPVNKVPVVALEKGGPTAGLWETFDLLINYKYTLSNNALDISGQITPSNFYQMNYANFRGLTVYAFALDKDNRVLKTVQLLFLGGVGTDEKFSFTQLFQLPAETTGLSFGYEGEATEAASSKMFSELPIDK